MEKGGGEGGCNKCINYNSTHLAQQNFLHNVDFSFRLIPLFNKTCSRRKQI